MGILRSRMEHDLVVRGRSKKTCRAYLYAVADLARYHHRSPDQLTDREVQQYVRHLIEERRLSWSTCRVTVCALRFFYEVTLGRKRSAFSIPIPKGGRKLPQILSREEVGRLLGGVDNLRQRVILMATYGAGLRVSEVARLRVADIDSKRMVIRVEQGKGKKDRYTLLSQRLLEELRCYYRVYRPTDLLFPQRRNHDAPLDTSSVRRFYYAARKRAGIAKSGGVHALRHAFATHLLESGTDIVTIQRMLGHGHLETTGRYLHVTRQSLAERASPLDLLPVTPVSTT